MLQTRTSLTTAVENMCILALWKMLLILSQWLQFIEEFCVIIGSTQDHLTELFHLLDVPLIVYISRNYSNQNLLICNPKYPTQWLKLSC
jgi:hypothetical protein